MAPSIRRASTCLSVVRDGSMIAVASRGSNLSMPPPSGWPSISQLSCAKSDVHEDKLDFAGASSFIRTMCTEFVAVQFASLRIRLGRTPDIYERKKSGTCTSGTEYHGSRTRHLYAFRAVLPSSVSRYRETALGSSLSFGSRRR